MDDPSQEAATAARAAAERAGVRIVEVADPTSARELTTLFDRVWGREPTSGSIMPSELLTAMGRAGCQVSAAISGDDVVGATAALVGWEERRPHLHSHVTGVVESAQRRGIGWALKQHQRAWALARGIEEVRWTFDPLIRRNVVFNLLRLGARAVAFHEDAYGQMPDARNRGAPTDRLVAHWRLTERRVALAAAGRAVEPDRAALEASGAHVLLRVGDGEVPHIDLGEAPRLLIQVPADIETIRADDPDLAATWAAATRTTLGDALARGFAVTGATRDGWLVLGRAHVEELAGTRS